MKYSNYSKMISMVAFHYYLKTGYDYEELIAQGNLIFCDCQLKYDQSIGQFSTLLYKSLKNGLHNFIYHEFKSNKIIENLFILSNLYYENEYKEKISISNEVKSIIDLLIENYHEILDFTKKKYSGSISRTGLFRYLKHIGWKRYSIINAFTEIKYLLSENAI